MIRVPPDHKIKVIAEIGEDSTPGERREPRHRESAWLGQGAKGPGKTSARKSPPK